MPARSILGDRGKDLPDMRALVVEYVLGSQHDDVVSDLVLYPILTFDQAKHFFAGALFAGIENPTRFGLQTDGDYGIVKEPRTVVNRPRQLGLQKDSADMIKHVGAFDEGEWEDLEHILFANNRTGRKPGRLTTNYDNLAGVDTKFGGASERSFASDQGDSGRRSKREQGLKTIVTRYDLTLDEVAKAFPVNEGVNALFTALGRETFLSAALDTVKNTPDKIDQLLPKHKIHQDSLIRDILALGLVKDGGFIKTKGFERFLQDIVAIQNGTLHDTKPSRYKNLKTLKDIEALGEEKLWGLRGVTNATERLILDGLRTALHMLPVKVTLADVAQKLKSIRSTFMEEAQLIDSDKADDRLKARYTKPAPEDGKPSLFHRKVVTQRSNNR